ncbi:hypothetical protein Ccrd_020355 [Cynara cardunculus var. scolymus]|uniref:TRF2/HOY1 PH-like domain-containing protein n=1 Tax=Cynara cardunculus var. scolymus TaxID=59895 RepID=A0A124SEW8_CYNCS|nr:hypothetical protein Ccrd_020355 [Cynara cardunculus var. scolymus]
MVQFMSSSENNNVWQLPEPEAKLFAGEENSMCFQQIADDGPLPKRWKSSSSSSSFQTATQQLKLNNSGPLTPQYQYNPLSEPSPLGLRLRKSPSLLELAQKRLNQCNTDKGDLPAEDFEAEINRDLRARSRTRASASADKLKASHFPALLLRIGQWEYVSKNEGDLVAKCYFSKHKIVWEILDGGLKKKFEINWADIMALKANTAADGLGTLTIVVKLSFSLLLYPVYLISLLMCIHIVPFYCQLDKQPLFFKEINPQPRKHTQWRASSDFTDGEASTHSQQQDIFLEFPYFAPKPSITNQDISGHSILNLPDMYGIANMTLASTLQTCSLTPLESSSLGLIDQDLSKAAHPSSSVSDLVNGLSEQQPFRNQPFSDNHVSGQETPKDMLANISQILLSDNHLTAAASDEKTLMSRVNSLCCLIQDYQKDGNDCSTLDPNLISGSGTQEDGTIGQSSKLPQDHRNGQQDRNDSSTLDTNLMHAGNMTEDGTVGLSTMLPEDHPNGQQDGNDNSNPESYPQDENVSGSGMSRKDSFAELVHQLPRIASLPRFLFDISENGEILK